MAAIKVVAAVAEAKIVVVEVEAKVAAVEGEAKVVGTDSCGAVAEAMIVYDVVVEN